MHQLMMKMYQFGIKMHQLMMEMYQLMMEMYPVENKNVPDKGDKTALILEFCHEPKSVLEIADYLGYKDKRSVRKYLNVLLSQGRISMTIPDKPNSSKQKYITIK